MISRLSNLFRFFDAAARLLARAAAVPCPSPASPFAIDGDEGDEGEARRAAVAERRCGWFDSSQDLTEGLAICEHACSDPVAAELPVMAWVQLQLIGWRPELGITN
jgi:hypothetical protein